MQERNEFYQGKENKKRVKRKKKRVKQTNRLLFAMGIVVLVLLIYLIITLCSLIGKTLEDMSQGNWSDGTTQGIWGMWNSDEESDDAESTKNSDKSKDDTESEDIHAGNTPASREEYVREQIRNFADEHQLSISDYPEELIESLIANEEKEEFVFNYPLKKGTYSNLKLTECIGRAQMPLLLQWDERWGYYPYGNGVIGVVGCGPTSLSMVTLHLLQDAKYTPIYMADYAMRNDYYAEGVGTAWDFMTKGARRLGLKVQEVGLDENVVMRHLRQGHPIICAVGPGDFTTTGHFIVLAGVEDGKIRIHDCNSRERSEKLWDFQEFKYQIKNMWAYSVR